MPIHVNELDEDSEEELDPEWMRLKMQMVNSYDPHGTKSKYLLEF
jgi:hypothetical protein